MAGAGYLVFTAGQVLTAAMVNTYLNQQTTMVFASASARDTALATVKAAGMVAVTNDTATLWMYDGTSWRSVVSSGANLTSAPTFSGSSGNPNLGTTGSTAIRYSQMGRTVRGQGKVSWSGTGGTTGSGYYYVPLPIAAWNTGAAYLKIGDFKGTTSGGLAILGSVDLDNLSTANARFSYAATQNATTDTALGAGSGMGTAGGSITFDFCYESLT
jgi:hypothetical protein